MNEIIQRAIDRQAEATRYHVAVEAELGGHYGAIGALTVDTLTEAQNLLNVAFEALLKGGYEAECQGTDYIEACADLNAPGYRRIRVMLSPRAK